MFALVLAGGKGERLRPLTSDRPKPMVPVNDKPILQHHLEGLGGDRPVRGTNGDNLTAQPLAPLLRAHRRSGAVATVMLAALRSPYGIVRLRGTRVLGFDEKPLLPYWVNAGGYVLDRECFAMLPEGGDHGTTAVP